MPIKTEILTGRLPFLPACWRSRSRHPTVEWDSLAHGEGHTGMANMTTDKLKALLAACKCGVSITVNEHLEVYETVEQRLAEWNERRDICAVPDVSDEVRRCMIETDTIIMIHFYPQHPVSFYLVAHYDIDGALDAALEYLRDEGLLQ